ncbi:tetratricopeptide repeat protein [bacterium]|nr:tetratricopeptide repeat protein [bacterium]
MKKALMIASILMIAVISTACINNIAVQELNNKANEYMQKGDYESAMNRLQASLDLDSTMYETYYNLGIAAINAKKYETAIEALEKGIVIKPEFSDFYYSLGVAQIALADEIMERDESVKEENNGKEGLQPIDIERAKELKSSAIENLLKYLDSVPDAKDKETVEQMLKECEDFINPSQGDSSKA